MTAIISSILTPILTALVVWFIERDRTKKDKLKEEAEEINREINNATMELAYADSVAITEGKTDGELKRARKAYETAVRRRDDFNQKLQNTIIK